MTEDELTAVLEPVLAQYLAARPDHRPPKDNEQLIERVVHTLARRDAEVKRQYNLAEEARGAMREYKAEAAAERERMGKLADERGWAEYNLTQKRAECDELRDEIARLKRRLGLATTERPFV